MIVAIKMMIPAGTMARRGSPFERPNSSMVNMNKKGAAIRAMNPQKMVQTPIPALRVHTILSPDISPSPGGSNRVED